MTDAELAAAIAREAGALLLGVQKRMSGKEAGAEGDRAANTLILERLAAARPHDAVLSEERKCDGSRVDVSRVWIVDPLDGTREFSEGRDDWAVHIALAVDGVATIGAVALPALNLVLASDPAPALPAAADPPRMLVSRSRPAAEALAVAEHLGAALVPMGSAGAKAMAVVRGEAEIYLHSGGQYEWDNCAPVAVAQAAGLHCSRIDGSPLVYNNADPYLPDLLICRPELAATILSFVEHMKPA
ncbi:MAG: 3'(2'),5'-bisphosphate nucleotidase CysQ [Pseudomonadota bacterium]